MLVQLTTSSLDCLLQGCNQAEPQNLVGAGPGPNLSRSLQPLVQRTAPCLLYRGAHVQHHCLCRSKPLWRRRHWSCRSGWPAPRQTARSWWWPRRSCPVQSARSAPWPCLAGRILRLELTKEVPSGQTTGLREVAATGMPTVQGDSWECSPDRCRNAVQVLTSWTVASTPTHPRHPPAPSLAAAASSSVSACRTSWPSSSGLPCV